MESMSESEDDPHSSNLMLHRQQEGSGTFFVTKCLENQESRSSDEDVFPEISSPLSFYAENG
jgi:hypothetical protein